MVFSTVHHIRVQMLTNKFVAFLEVVQSYVHQYNIPLLSFVNPDFVFFIG